MSSKYSHEEWMRICEDWKQSGLSQSEFGRQKCISVQTLNYWITKHKNKGAETFCGTKEPIKFFPVANITSEKSFLEITLLNGLHFKVHLPAEKINAFLVRLLKCK